MKIAAAQTVPKDGNIIANLADHCRLAEHAAAHGAAVVIFPEMSLTGYQLGGARGLSFARNDERLEPLRMVATDNNIIILAGAPIEIESVLHIGAFALYPDQEEMIYTKQFLHDGEEQFFSPSFGFDPRLNIGDDSISLAICADIVQPVHAANAAAAGSTVYLAGIFYSPKGMAAGYEDLSARSADHNMYVIMANYGGPSCGMPAAGGSAAWDKAGKRLAQLGSEGEGLLILETGPIPKVEVMAL